MFVKYSQNFNFLLNLNYNVNQETSKSRKVLKFHLVLKFCSTTTFHNFKVYDWHFYINFPVIEYLGLVLLIS